MREEAIRFGNNEGLVGIITKPDQSQPAPVVLFVNAGMIHHVGPSRLYVRLARNLAQNGITSMRFDFAGIGDSCPRADDLVLEDAVIADVRETMDYIESQLGPTQFLMIGHCSGAWISFLLAGTDERIIGANLMNPEGLEADWVEYDRQRKVASFYGNYYRREVLGDPDRWKKLLTGKADYRNIIKNVAQNIVWNRVSSVAFRARSRMGSIVPAEDEALQGRLLALLEVFMERRIRLMLTYSQGSTSIERTQILIGPALKALEEQGLTEELVIPNADHTFTLLNAQQAVIESITAWTCSFISELS